MKVSPAFSKAAGCRGGAPGRPPRRAEPPCAYLSAGGGSKGEPSPGVPPFLYSCACAPLLWAVVVALSCLSTPFLWCLPKETVSSRQRKALFYPGGSTIRVSAPASVDGTHLRPTWGGAGAGFWAHRAFESFARLFKGGGVQGRSPWPPAAAGRTPLCLFERRRGSKGEPSPGVPLYLLLRYCALYACAADCIRIKIPRHLLHCGRRGDTFSGQGSAEKRRAAPARSPGHGASRPRAARAALPA